MVRVRVLCAPRVDSCSGIQSPTGGRHVRVNVNLPSFCRAQINKGTWEDCGKQASRVPFI